MIFYKKRGCASTKPCFVSAHPPLKKTFINNKDAAVQQAPD